MPPGFLIQIAFSRIFGTNSFIKINSLRRYRRLSHDVPDGCSKSSATADQFRPPPEARIFGNRIASDAGLPAYREPDHALGLTGMAGSIQTEVRRGKNIRHLVEVLFRQSVFGRPAGYQGVIDRDIPPLAFLASLGLHLNEI